MSNLNALKMAAIVLFIVFCNSASAVITIKTTLKRGMFTKRIIVNAISNGGYRDKCLKLNITNPNSDTAVSVFIDPAMIFGPDQPGYQNLVALGNETIAVAPSATVSIDLQAYCGISYAHSPAANVSYKFLKQGDSIMIKTMTFIKQHNISNYIAQSAVWMFTNEHPLSRVYSRQDPANSELLVKYTAGLKKIKVPEMYMEIKQNDRIGEAVVSVRDIPKLYVPVKWSNDNTKRMYVTVYKENGDVYKKVDGHEEIDYTGHTVWVEFNIVNDAKGVYFVELKDEDNLVLQRKKVNVGYSIEEGL